MSAAGELGVKLRGKVTRLDPQRRVATVRVPAVGRGRSFRTDFAMPNESLARAVEFGYASPTGRPVGSVIAVRPRDSGAEIDVHVTGDTAWQRLADRGARVDVGCAFSGAVGLDPTGGRVTRVDID